MLDPSPPDVLELTGDGGAAAGVRCSDEMDSSHRVNGI